MEKWCDGNPSTGPTNNIHNLLGTYKNSVSPEFDAVFVDETYRNHLDINDILLKTVTPSVYDNLVISFLGDSNMNPTVDTLNKIGEYTNLIFIWPDTGYPWAQRRISQLTNHTHISWGGEDVTPLCGKHKFLFAPQSTDLYFPDDKVTDVSFVGSLFGYTDRNEYLSYAMSKTQITTVGGQREENLTAEQYAEAIRTSRMNINFPQSPSGKDQFKGRCVEIIASKTLLLERENEATKRFLTPNEHYVEFTTKEDLVSKINYLKDNPNLVEDTSERAYEFYKKNYTSDVFWKEVLGNV